MSIPTHITKAGSFNVQQVPCAHLSQPVLLNAPRAAVLHTTEGSWSASLAEFREKWAPHFLLGMHDKTKKVEVAQLVPFGFIGASLEHHNNLAICQIEMVGFSKETPWLPDPETLDALASTMNAVKQALGVPLFHPYKDGDYGMYGYHNNHRSKFGTMQGWFGHADVPDNAHWDPGNLEWSKVFQRAVQLEAKPTDKVS